MRAATIFAEVYGNEFCLRESTTMTSRDWLECQFVYYFLENLFFKWIIDAWNENGKIVTK